MILPDAASSIARTHLPIRPPRPKYGTMKTLIVLLGLLLAAGSAHAQCKDCGCKAKCSPTCQCPQDGKAKTQ